MKRKRKSLKLIEKISILINLISFIVLGYSFRAISEAGNRVMELVILFIVSVSIFISYINRMTQIRGIKVFLR